MHQPSRDVFLEAISAPGRPPSGDSVQSLPHRQYSSRMLHLKQIRKEARRVAQRMLEVRVELGTRCRSKCPEWCGCDCGWTLAH